MGIGSDSSRPLTEGIVESTTETAVGLLSGLAGWFRQPSDLSIARCILAKAEEIGSKDPLDMHFLYQAMIEIYYRARESNPMALNEAIDACQKQIKLAPNAALAFRQETDELPAHVGYRQLAIVFEKERNYHEAIELSREAMNSGWAGDWQKRIERCERKLSSLYGSGNAGIHDLGRLGVDGRQGIGTPVRPRRPPCR